MRSQNISLQSKIADAMENVLLVYCIEETVKRRPKFTYFANADLPNILKVKNALVHYHNSTAAFPSVEVQIINGHVIYTDLEHDITPTGFTRFIKRATTTFPVTTYSHLLVLQGHCWIHELSTYMTKFKDVKVITSQQVAHTVKRYYGNSKLAGIVFDCCYMSTVETAKCVSPITDYMLACESASPNFGFIGCSPHLHKHMHLSTRSLLKKLVDNCVKYNSNPLNRFIYPTDGAIWYLPNLHILEKIKASDIKMQKRCAILKGHRLYDLYKCSVDKNLDLSKLIVYYAATQNALKGVAITTKKGALRAT